MDKSSLKKIIKEELKKIIKENSEKRYVATIEFFVWGKDEADARSEAEEILELISNKYDNSAQITDLTAQSFGSVPGKPIKTHFD